MAKTRTPHFQNAKRVHRKNRDKKADDGRMTKRLTKSPLEEAAVKVPLFFKIFLSRSKLFQNFKMNLKEATQQITVAVALEERQVIIKIGESHVHIGEKSLQPLCKLLGTAEFMIDKQDDLGIRRTTRKKWYLKNLESLAHIETTFKVEVATATKERV